VRAQQLAQLRRQRVERLGLTGEERGIEARRPAHGLGRVVQEDVETILRLHQVPREQLHAGGVAQVEAVDLEARSPGLEVFLSRVASGGVVGETRGGDDAGPGAQELQGGLEADLHARSRHERDPAVERRGLEALLVVEGRALRAHRVVEEVEPPILGLADVARPRLEQLALGGRSGGTFEAPARGHVDRRLPGRADLGGRPRRAVLGLDLLALGLAERADQAPGLVVFGARHAAGGDQQGLALLVGEPRQQRAVVHHRLQQADGAPDLFEIQLR
jgi:hypothetical protein